MNEKNEKVATTLGLIEDTVVIGKDVKIYPNVYLLGDTVIGDGTIIYPNTTIISSVIGEKCSINNSVIEHSTVKDGASIGPYAHLRPNSVIGKECLIGNFVEVKNSIVGDKTHAAHHAYIGDADIGENCNIGCGVIFVNYNGHDKNRTIVEDNCFIGSNCNVVAPVHISEGSYICAGTTITIDTKADDFVIGRCREVVKENYAHKYLRKK